MSGNRAGRRKAAFAVTASLAAVVILAAGLELGLRVAGYKPLGVGPAAEGRNLYLQKSSDPILGYEPRPGFRGRVFGVGLQVNRQGFRGRERTADPGPAFRLGVVGDSIVFAKEFEEEQTFVGLLEAKLAGAGRPVEVLNFGVEGYDSLQEIQFLERVGLPLGLDGVVLCVGLNDIGLTPMDPGYADVHVRTRFEFIRRLRLYQWVKGKLRKIALQRDLKRSLESGSGVRPAYRGLFPEVEADDFLRERFREIALAQQSFAASAEDKKRAVADKAGLLWLNQYASPYNLGKIRYAFTRLKDLSGRAGFRVLVAVVPFLYTVGGEYIDGPAHAIVRREAERLGLEVLDLLPSFRPGGLHNHTLDGVHFNAAGHGVMAEALRQALASWFELRP
jgi:lysophospholipase L1-like esterase